MVAGVAPVATGSPPVLQPVRAPAPTVAVVDATSGTGDAERVHRRLADAGYIVRSGVIDGVTPQEPTVVWWRDRDRSADASQLAELIGADDLRMVDGTAPRPVLEAGGDVVVQVGSPAP